MSAEPRARPAGFFVARTPLLPLETLTRWQAAPREELAALVARPEVREALFFASPGLLASLPEWAARPDTERGAKIERALVSYLARMAVRTTPFGLFAGCSFGLFCSDETRLELPPLAAYGRRTRLDLEAVDTVVRGLERRPEIRAGLRYSPQSSLHVRGEQLRYVETTVGPTGVTRRLTALDASPYLEAVLARARPGARPSELAEALCAMDAELTHDEAAGFIDELIDAGVLEPALAPPQTGPEPLAALALALEATPAGAPVGRLVDALESLDARGLGRSEQEYAAVAGELAALVPGAADGRLWQVDLYKPAVAARLGRELEDALASAVQWIERLGGGSAPLAGFKARFLDRYGSKRVPLLDVLEDPALGVTPSGLPGSEPAPLLVGLSLAAAPEPSSPPSARDAWLAARVEAVLAGGGDTLELGEADAPALAPTPRVQLPTSFSLLCTLLAEGPEALAEGRFRLLVRGADGPSGINVLTRFGGIDSALDSAMRAHAEAEEALDPEARYAEVVHVPEPRHANLLQRPLLRRLELPYLGRSGARTEDQLHADDLELGLEDGRLRLYSRSRGRRVVPRISTAYDHERAANLPLYRLLGMMQTEDGTGALVWRWGALASRAELPRVTSGRLVLAPRRWRIEPTRVSVATLREERRWPRWLALVEDGGVLPIDLDHPQSAAVLGHRLRQERPVVLEELLAHPGQGAARGPEGTFATELIVPYLDARPRPAAPPIARTVQARVAPGVSPDWLFLKLYLADHDADAVLLERVRPLVERVGRAGAADRWFFMRYADPAWHVRLRFHGDVARLERELEGAFEGDARVWRVEREGYEPEVARYGGVEALPFSERIFQADSEATLELLATSEPEARWRLALLSAHALMVDFGLDLPARLAMARSQNAGYRREHLVSEADESQLSARFRQERRSLAALLASGAFAQRSARIAPWVAELTRLGVAGAVLPSLLHMAANRLLRARHRAQELVIHEFLARLYASELARK